VTATTTTVAAAALNPVHPQHDNKITAIIKSSSYAGFALNSSRQTVLMDRSSNFEKFPIQITALIIGQ
jgi:hypothetical protein